MLKKYIFTFIIFVFVIIGLQNNCFSVNVEDVYNCNDWRDLSIELIDEAIRVCDEEGNNQYINYIYTNILGIQILGSGEFTSYEEAQHYKQLAEHLLNEIRESATLRGAMGNNPNSEDQYWTAIENNIQLAQNVKEPSTEQNGNDENNDGNNGGTPSSEENKETWNTYSVNDYKSTLSVGVAWDLLENVDIDILGKEDLNKYIQCVEAIFNRRTEVDSSIAGKISERKDEIYEYAMENYSEVLKDTEAGKIISGDKPVYENTLIGYNPDSTATKVDPDDIIKDGDEFMSTGGSSDIVTINQENANTVFESIYNILLAIGITVTVVWGLVIAIKLMVASVEEKAEYKQMLWPYLIGCIVIFGSFIIWKIVIIIMNNVL